MNYENQLKGKQILLGSEPTDSHFNILKGLAKYLKKSGCEVRWYTSGKFKEQIDELAIQHYPFNKAKDFDALSSSVESSNQDFGARSEDMAAIAIEHQFRKNRPEYYADIIEIYKTFPFELMIMDSSFSAVPSTKKRINIPVVTVAAMPLKELSTVWLPMAPVYLMQKLAKNRVHITA